MVSKKTKKIILVLSMSVIVSILSLKSLFYFKKHIKYKKPIKEIKLKSTNNITDYNYNKKIINKLIGNINKTKLSNHSKDKSKDKIHIVTGKDFLKMLNQMVTNVEKKKQEEILSTQKQHVVVNRGGQEIQWITIRISYYTVSYSECNKTDGITASGKHIESGMIAAPTNIPFGTKINIPEINTIYTVEDRGSAIKWDGGIMKIDVYIPNATQKQLINLGVKYVKGYFIK
ncbi:3D domain-containing protein [Clostridium sp.]|uniref:3D domain-containing protein n=1 Tax=Clostridium sp. TaxID=1506 RepID=UPI00262ED059|nr:3D domain-containing protein [Clostridium sp.]